MKKTEIPRAIMSAWNIEADLNVVTGKVGKYQESCKLIFFPHEDNDVNNEWLEEYGLYLKDGKKYRELHYIKDDSFAWEPNNYEGILQLN